MKSREWRKLESGVWTVASSESWLKSGEWMVMCGECISEIIEFLVESVECRVEGRDWRAVSGE